MKPFFTIPDPDLVQESSVDPMGLQVIWTYYGQSIFKEKLTTIANDLRVFTFNLFHTHLIHRLFQDHPEEMAIAKERYQKWETEQDIKAGLYMLLEDLVTWVFYEAKNKGKVNSDQILGILGMSKARMADNSGKTIVLSADKSKGLLKNQFNLGMIGRYKGPMIQMEFFSRSFEIKHAQNPQWDKVEKLMYNWNEGKNLQKTLVELILNLLKTSIKKDCPQITREELKSSKYWKKISDGYLSCFGSNKPVKEIRQFWKDKLGLLSGATAALYLEISKLKKEEFIDHQQVFVRALSHLKQEPEERKKIQDVIDIEPFLSHTEYLMRFIAQRHIKKISDYRNDLTRLRNEILSASNFSLQNSPQQLKNLHTVIITEGSLEDWIQNVFSYHKQIMAKRGGNSWIDLDEDGNLKHYFSPFLIEALNTIPKYLKERPWWHTYYLETVRSIHKGLK